MNTEDLIKALKTSKLYAECDCGGQFKISDAILFDGTKDFPEEAKKVKNQIEQEYKEREEDLKKSKKKVPETSKRQARSIGTGNYFECVAPVLKDFKWEPSDCRSLGKPIDLIIFNGMYKNKISSIDFVEIKTGKSPLKKGNERAVKEAVEDKRVSYKEFI